LTRDKFRFELRSSSAGTSGASDDLLTSVAKFTTRDRKEASHLQLGAQMSIFTILFVVLLVAWLMGFTVFHVASGMIHICLLLP